MGWSSTYFQSLGAYFYFVHRFVREFFQSIIRYICHSCCPFRPGRGKCLIALLYSVLLEPIKTAVSKYWHFSYSVFFYYNICLDQKVMWASQKTMAKRLAVAIWKYCKETRFSLNIHFPIKSYYEYDWQIYRSKRLYWIISQVKIWQVE